MHIGNIKLPDIPEKYPFTVENIFKKPMAKCSGGLGTFYVLVIS